MSGGVNGSVQASAGAGPALKRVLRRAAAASPFFTGRRSGGASAAGGLAACACGEEANVVDLTTGEVLLTLPGDTELVTAVALSPDGRAAFVASRALAVRQFALPLAAEARAARAAAFAKGGGDGDAAGAAHKAELVRSFKAHPQPVATMRVDPSGRCAPYWRRLVLRRVQGALTTHQG